MQQSIANRGIKLPAIFHFCLLLPLGEFRFMFTRILILAFSTRFVHSYATSQRIRGFFYAAIKHKTLQMFLCSRTQTAAFRDGLLCL